MSRRSCSVQQQIACATSSLQCITTRSAVCLPFVMARPLHPIGLHSLSEELLTAEIAPHLNARERSDYPTLGRCNAPSLIMMLWKITFAKLKSLMLDFCRIQLAAVSRSLADALQPGTNRHISTLCTCPSTSRSFRRLLPRPACCGGAAMVHLS